MRRPDFDLPVRAPEFGTAFADQRLQRIRGGGDAERLHLVAGRPRHRGCVFLLGGEAELLRQLRIERGDGRGGAVVGRRKFALRGFVETRTCGETPIPALPREGGERGRRLRILQLFPQRLGVSRLEPSPACGVRGERSSLSRLGGGEPRDAVHERYIALRHILAGAAGRGAGAVRGGLAAGAAIPGIIRRRLQSGGRADAAFAAVDRGIEQFRQRRPDRLHVRPRGLGIRRFRFRGFDGLFRMVGMLRHQANMG